MLNICTKFRENISKDFRVINTISILNFTKGHGSKDKAGGVTVLNFCTLSDDA